MLRSDLELNLKMQIIDKLSNYGFIDGENLANSSIHKQDITFWNNILENSKIARNNSYIVYSIQSYSDKIYGDGKSVIERLYCNIDIFTIYGNESRETYEIRNSVESCFQEFPWEIDFNLYEYDSQNKLHHYSYTVSTIIGAIEKKPTSSMQKGNK